MYIVAFDLFSNVITFNTRLVNKIYIMPNANIYM